jgi:hypothetical protein
LPLNLNPDEKKWLDEYRQALEREYPGLIEDMVIFRAEDARSYLPEYTLNTVVILKRGNRQTRKDVDFLGHSLAVLSDAIPFVWVYTRSEWKHHRLNGSLPYKGDAISVWSNQF